MFQQFIKNMFWFLPTKNEQEKNIWDLYNSYKKNIPEIKKKIDILNNQTQYYENKIMSSNQAENLLNLKATHQKILFEQTRLQRYFDYIANYQLDALKLRHSKPE